MSKGKDTPEAPSKNIEKDIKNDDLEGIEIESVDMDLDETVTIEAMGAERYTMVVQYNRSRINAKANRAVGNTQQADQIEKGLAAMKMAVAMIDRDCPKAKRVMQRIASEERNKILALAR